MRELLVFCDGEVLRFTTNDLINALNAKIITMREYADMSCYIVKCSLGV